MTESNTNIVMFPKFKKNHPPQSLEEIQDEISSMRSSKAEDVVASCMISLMENFANAGIDVMDPELQENLKYNTWLLEAVRLVIYRKLGLDHPWGDLVEKLYKVESHPDHSDLLLVKWEYDELVVEPIDE